MSTTTDKIRAALALAFAIRRQSEGKVYGDVRIYLRTPTDDLDILLHGDQVVREAVMYGLGTVERRVVHKGATGSTIFLDVTTKDGIKVQTNWPEEPHDCERVRVTDEDKALANAAVPEIAGL